MTETNELTLTLSAQEAVAIANIIGQLPTQTNAYPLYLKVKSQLESQMQAEQPAAESVQ